MTTQVKLAVNGTPIETDYFVEAFIDHVVSGMVESLENAGKIGNCKLSIEGNKVSLNLNNAPVAVNPFVSKIMKNTVTGMVSSLKGVNEIKKIDISVVADKL